MDSATKLWSPALTDVIATSPPKRALKPATGTPLLIAAFPLASG
jgi:hypothetical protein